jgi:hypothetical protein
MHDLSGFVKAFPQRAVFQDRQRSKDLSDKAKRAMHSLPTFLLV